MICRWDWMLLALVLYTAVDTPLQLGFKTAANSVTGVLDQIVLAFFWADMLVTFRTAYIDRHGELVRNGGAVAAYYLRTWFVIDLMSSLPWNEMLSGSSAGLAGQLLKLLRLLRLAR